MTLSSVAISLVTTYAVFWSIYVIVPPIVAVFRTRKSGTIAPPPGSLFTSMVVLIPAHNMSDYITKCLSSIFACDYPRDRMTVCVIADHCSDDTEDLSRQAGARVLTRDRGPRGKTYTLSWAIEEVRTQGMDPDMYVIVDATAQVHPGFLKSFAAYWAKGEKIIIARAILDTTNRKWFAQCIGLTLAHRNLQNWARESLGLSAFVSGRGMAYSRAYIERFGWRLALPTSLTEAAHPTEDFRHGVRLVKHGYRAAFADTATVYTPLRESLGAATSQGVRWEKGRIKNALTHASALLMEGIRDRDGLKVFAAMDAVQPPVAVLAALTVVLALASATVLQSTLGTTIAVSPFALIFLYGLFVVARGKRDGIAMHTILWAPVYIAWRSLSFMLAWLQTDPVSSLKNDDPSKSRG